MIPMTAELAQICLEAEEIKLYSSSPDRQFSFTIRFSLVDEDGRPYTSSKGDAAPKPHVQAAAQYQLRRGRAAERRRAEEERTFCLYTSLPASMAGADDERIARAREAVHTQIRAHFQRAAVRAAPTKTKEGRERGADQFFVTRQTNSCPSSTSTSGRTQRRGSTPHQLASTLSICCAAWMWEPPRPSQPSYAPLPSSGTCCRSRAAACVPAACQARGAGLATYSTFTTA